MIVTEHNMRTGANPLLPAAAVAPPEVWRAAADSAQDGGIGADRVEQACQSALLAFDSYAETEPVQRADLLDRIADNIETLGAHLATQITADTRASLDQARTEVAATIDQLRFFGDLVRSGSWMGLRVARSTRKLAQASAHARDLRQRHVAVGPVAIIAANGVSPLFSIIGAGAAAALAAGCTVVISTPSVHAEIARLVSLAVKKALVDGGLREAVFSLLPDTDGELKTRLASDGRIAAVTCMGARADALALHRIAAARERPIPVYGTAHGVSTLIALPTAWAARGGAILDDFFESLQPTCGANTASHGLFVTIAARGLETFTAMTGNAWEISTLPATADHANPWISAANLLQLPSASSFAGLDLAHYDVCVLSHAHVRTAPSSPEPTRIVAIVCRDTDAMQTLLARWERQSSISLYLNDGDLPQARTLLAQLEKKADLIRINDVRPDQDRMEETGIPSFYSSTDARSLSSGNLAIARFLRPVTYQDFPDMLLPEKLSNSSCLWSDARAGSGADFSAYILEHAAQKQQHR